MEKLEGLSDGLRDKVGSVQTKANGNVRVVFHISPPRWIGDFYTFVFSSDGQLLSYEGGK